MNQYFPNNQCVIETQDRPGDFKGMKYQKSSVWFQNPPTSKNLTFKKISFVEFWCQIKKEYPPLYKRTFKILSPFPVAYLCEVKFSSYISTKMMYHIRLDAEAAMEQQLFSIKLNIKEIYPNVKQCFFSHPSWKSLI